MTETNAIVVSGLPRSGTTWVASLLGHGHGTSLIAREPMNPRPGGFNLNGLLTHWTSLDLGAEKPVVDAWRHVFSGRQWRLYGKQGRQQLLAPLPGRRLIVKDPFATLSLGFLRREFGINSIAVYRPPEALLASHRRMGWKTDWKGLLAALDQEVSHPPESQIQAISLLWRSAYQHILDLPNEESPTIVAHQDLAVGGIPAARALYSELGLQLSKRGRQNLEQAFHAGSTAPPPPGQLHASDRDPRSTTDQWRSRVSEEEAAELRKLTSDIRDRLADRRLILGTT
ncbi:sulfotransferase [Georgenia deserti]|uniref:Sulfotransferase n=1 Tax=Georgenia deserti TaxID=2093781 RepID=A0ABW4L5W5_9MICO